MLGKMSNLVLNISEEKIIDFDHRYPEKCSKATCSFRNSNFE
jgi:hypothetical protein